MASILDGMTAEQIQKYKEAFKLFDANGDDKISTKELNTLMLSLGATLSQRELASIMEELDANRNGFIDFEEFVVLMNRKENEGYSEEEIKEAFKMFDKDGNGFIDKTELKGIMMTLGESMDDQEVENMIRDADVNGDGKIQYEEFVTLMFS